MFFGKRRGRLSANTCFDGRTLAQDASFHQIPRNDNFTATTFAVPFSRFHFPMKTADRLEFESLPAPAFLQNLSSCRRIEVSSGSASPVHSMVWTNETESAKCSGDLSACEFITCAAPGADCSAMKREGLNRSARQERRSLGKSARRKQCWRVSNFQKLNVRQEGGMERRSSRRGHPLKVQRTIETHNTRNPAALDVGNLVFLGTDPSPFVLFRVGHGQCEGLVRIARLWEDLRE